MKLAHVTGLGRHLDIGLRSNQIALLGSVAVGVLHGALELLTNGGIVIVGSVAAGALVFLAWAISREIDPDHPESATIAMGLAAPFALFGGGSVLVVAVLLMALRMIAGTTGVALMPADLAVVVASAVVAGVVAGGWVLVPLLAFGAAKAVDHRPLATAGLVAGTGLLTALAAGTLVIAGDLMAAAICVATLLITRIGRPLSPVTSARDAGGRLMDNRRVVLAERLAAMAAVALGIAVAGVGGYVVAGTVVAAWLHRQLDRRPSERRLSHV